MNRLFKWAVDSVIFRIEFTFSVILSEEVCKTTGIKKSAHGLGKISATRAANAHGTVAQKTLFKNYKKE